MKSAIGVFNAGSSSLKFSLFDSVTLSLLYRGKVDRVFTNSTLLAQNAAGEQVVAQGCDGTGHHTALAAVLGWMNGLGDIQLALAGHRVVHGGGVFTSPVRIAPDIVDTLKTFIPLAPLHQPHTLHVIEALQAAHPALPQIACFDTAFHHTQPWQASMFALPRALYQEGIRRYGFHGLSYEYIASVLPSHAAARAEGRVIVAHLGNGASMCAMRGLKSQATTMGFSTLDGMMMGTRCGQLDVGVVLYLQQHKGFSPAQVEELLYNQSGLKGVSGISQDMRTLIASDTQEASEAITLYCYEAAKQIAAMTACIGGLDVLVFTAGIGENQPQIRTHICEALEWMGIKLDAVANGKNAALVSSSLSAVEVRVIPTNEEWMIARHCIGYLL